MRHLPSLRTLQSFEATVRTGTLTAAARELNVTTGAVSRQITALEDLLGTPLMRRGRAGIDVTEAGRLLNERLARAFASIDKALDETMKARDSDAITVSVFPTFAIQWLVPRLPDLFAIAPDVDLRLRPSLQDRPFDRDEIDVAISIGLPDDARLHSRTLFPRLFTPVCNRATLEHVGTDPAASLHRTRIFYSDRQVSSWRRWLEAIGLGSLDLPKTGIRFENSSLAYQAAREGIGFAIGQPTLLRNDLESGRLLAPFAEIVESELKYIVECRKTDRDRRPIRLFMDWITAEARSSEQARSVITLRGACNES